MYPLMTQTTIRTYRDWGPYFKPETDIHVIQNLADLISWTRYYMTDAIPDYIAVYKDDLLIGGWSAQGDAEPDGVSGPDGSDGYPRTNGTSGRARDQGRGGRDGRERTARCSRYGWTSWH